MTGLTRLFLGPVGAGFVVAGASANASEARLDAVAFTSSTEGFDATGGVGAFFGWRVG